VNIAAGRIAWLLFTPWSAAENVNGLASVLTLRWPQSARCDDCRRRLPDSEQERYRVAKRVTLFAIMKYNCFNYNVLHVKLTGRPQGTETAATHIVLQFGYFKQPYVVLAY
jgi:hypothetical protein